MSIIFAPPDGQQNLSISLNEREAEELLVALALRRKQLGNAGVELTELAAKLDAIFVKAFGWDATIDRVHNGYFSTIKKVTLR